MTEYVICCSGKSRPHGRIDFPPLVREGESVTERLIHRRPGPWGAGATIVAGEETSHMPPSYPVKSESARRMHGDEERWRWKCPACGLDRPMTGEKLRAWMDLADTTPDTPVLDISVLPR